MELASFFGLDSLSFKGFLKSFPLFFRQLIAWKRHWQRFTGMMFKERNERLCLGDGTRLKGGKVIGMTFSQHCPARTCLV